MLRYATVFCLILPVWAQQTDWSELVAAERGFAATSREKGSVQAFKTWLAEDSVLFRPTPTGGQAFYKDRKQGSGSLWWQPAHVVVSADGDLGFSTGPYHARSNKEDKGFYGRYFSVWQRQKNGEWRVLIDDGIGHKDYPESSWPTKVGGGPLSPGPGNEAHTLEGLLQQDRAYAATAEEHGLTSALLAVAATEIQVFRRGHHPLNKTAIASLDEDDVKATWEPAGGILASSKDLGYTYGVGKVLSDSRRLIYIRIWRASPDGFLLLAELLNILKS